MIVFIEYIVLHKLNCVAARVVTTPSSFYPDAAWGFHVSCDNKPSTIVPPLAYYNSASAKSNGIPFGLLHHCTSIGSRLCYIHKIKWRTNTLRIVVHIPHVTIHRQQLDTCSDADLSQTKRDTNNNIVV